MQCKFRICVRLCVVADYDDADDDDDDDGRKLVIGRRTPDITTILFDRV